MLADIPDAKTGEKIYVSNSAANNIETYATAGKATKPTITKGINDPGITAVVSKGKIYVSNAFTSNVTTHKPNGQQTTPTISNIDGPRGIAVDAKVKFTSQILEAAW